MQGQAQVKEVQHKGESSRICLQFPDSKLQGIQVGASVAINGTCLTVSMNACPQKDVRLLRSWVSGIWQLGGHLCHEQMQVLRCCLPHRVKGLDSVVLYVP